MHPPNDLNVSIGKVYMEETEDAELLNVCIE